MAEEYGKIRKSLLTGIADAIRAKKDTTAIFTPEQMAVEIEGIVTGDDLPNAEDVSFGTVGVTTEYGMTANTGTTYAKPGDNTMGWEFQLNEAIVVYGFRYRIAGSKIEHNLMLWDADGTLLASATSTPKDFNSWTEVMLDEPVLLLAGTYTVAAYTSGNPMVKSNFVTFNDKIKNARSMYLASSYGKPTTYDENYTAVVDIIFGPPQTESTVNEYKIQTDTMTQIADEVKRITGATATLSPAQMLTALQGIATPTTE